MQSLGLWLVVRSVPARSPELQFWRLCSVAISIALISSSWSGSGLLTTTVSEASVSGDSVGEITGDVLTVSSTVGCCSCLGCVGFFAPRWSGACADSSPVPGASSFGSLVDGGGGGVRPTSEHWPWWSGVGCYFEWWGLLRSHHQLFQTGSAPLHPPSWARVWPGFGSWPGWLAVGRLSARVRCPRVATIACNSMYRFSCSASWWGDGCDTQ